MKIKIVALSLFISGAGTKLIQSQIGNSKQVMTLPSYPLLYFYSHWEVWIKKYSKLTISKIFKLLMFHHGSVIDSSKILGFNGLNNLGKDKNKSIKVSKKKFKYFFQKYLENKEISSKNVLIAIHYAFHRARGKSFKKIKYILFHIHNYEYYKKYLMKDFPNSKLILITRNPLENFWRRAFTNSEIEKKRYDYTDKEYLKNFTYLNLLKQIFLDIDHIDNSTINKTKNILFKFENLKEKNLLTIKKVYKFLGIKFNKNYLIPKFLGLQWWSHKNYKGYNSKKIFSPKINLDPNDNKKFFFYEKILLKILFFSFYKKFNYKISLSKLYYLIFMLIIFLPTKYGLSLFFSRINIVNIFFFIKEATKECFRLELKNYYFNAMYKHKYLYRDKYFINFNFLRKYTYKKKKANFILIFSVFLFLFKLLSYLYFQFELIFLYFHRIYKIIEYFIKINFLKKKFINKLKLS